MTDRRAAGRPLAVPSSRIARLSGFGGLAAGVAGGMARDGARLLAQGRRPALRDLVLTPANVARAADELARMRGAAMKVGQLLSMDAGELLAPELAEILSRLRADADHMPPRQLKRVLTANWGEGWLGRFARFDVRPVAAASIGQVHRARTRDGRDLAIKVQYPGVRRSIDSDVDNVAALIRWSGLLPPGLEIAPLLVEAKRQLHEEADYEREGERLARFGALLADAPEFALPELQPDLTTRDVLAMTFVEGAPIESLADAPQAERDRVATLLVRLLFRELFEFRLMQTDPNFANYRYERETGRVILLDFGATRRFAPEVAARYRRLMRAGLDRDRAGVLEAALEIGFFNRSTAPHHQEAALAMIETVFAAARGPGPFDFADRALARRLHEAGMALGADRSFAHAPPPDALFLQRKFGGTYLLASRLGARVDVRALLEAHL